MTREEIEAWVSREQATGRLGPVSPRFTDAERGGETCDCYPGGFTADTYEGPQEDCPVHGRPSPESNMKGSEHGRESEVSSRRANARDEAGGGRGPLGVGERASDAGGTGSSAGVLRPAARGLGQLLDHRPAPQAEPDASITLDVYGSGEPDAADIETVPDSWAELADEIHDALGGDCRGDRHLTVARAVLASDWLAARDAAVARKASEKAWDEAVNETWACGWLHDFAKSDALARNAYRAEVTP